MAFTRSKEIKYYLITEIRALIALGVRMVISRNPFHRRDSGNAEGASVDFQVPTCPRDFHVTFSILMRSWKRVLDISWTHTPNLAPLPVRSIKHTKSQYWTMLKFMHVTFYLFPFFGRVIYLIASNIQWDILTAS